MRLVAAAIGFALAVAPAQAQKIYKHVDEKGRVTYSQTPPSPDAKTVPVPLPRRLPSGMNDEDPGRRESRRSIEEAQAEAERRHAESMQKMEEQRQQRLKALRDECVRNRGTDCDDPNTLARMQEERGPSQYRPRAR